LFNTSHQIATGDPTDANHEILGWNKVKQVQVCIRIRDASRQQPLPVGACASSNQSRHDLFRVIDKPSLKEPSQATDGRSSNDTFGSGTNPHKGIKAPRTRSGLKGNGHIAFGEG
jgi:hypothetical protein